jgi:ABC-2 type transport system ATP-binding protein
LMYTKPDMSQNDAVTIKNFSKSFGDKKVIDNISFSVKKGDIFAFLGANGSGKTTTIRSLLGLYFQDKGELLINGEKFTIEMSKYIGYLPEDKGLYKDMKVLEMLIFFAKLKGLDKKTAKKRAVKFLKRVDLTDKAKVKIKNLSSGQQQKIQLGITIIHKPKLLILDEPTNGLDPVNRRLLLDILSEANNQGATIIFSTHLMEEAEKIAKTVLILKQGKILEYGDLEEVKHKYSNNEVIVQAKSKIPANPKLYTMIKDTEKIKLKKNVTISQVIKFLVSKNIEILKVEKNLPTLEEIFIKVMSK